jgi:hypothetical protein
MTTLHKNVTYNAQGDIVPGSVPISSTSTTATTTTPLGTNSYTSMDNYSASTLAPRDSTWKGKFTRTYSRIETAMRNKWDSSTGYKSRSDPLGGYTIKGPGYYEKKHKFTRRVTTRGTPPSSFNTTPTYVSSTPTYVSTPTDTVPTNYSSSTTPFSSGPGAYSSNIQQEIYTTPSVHYNSVTPTHIPNSYTTPSVPVA